MPKRPVKAKPDPKTDEIASFAKGRPVKHPNYKAVFHYGEKALTQKQLKEMIGWEEELEDGPKFGADYLLTDRYGKKIRCHNNLRNRPLYMANVEGYVQDRLDGKWEKNGEPIIIGVTGVVLNGQHQIVAAILAEQDRMKDKLHWDSIWDTEITLEKLVVYGIEESDRVVNTMDTCKPRSLADVIYRSEFFAKSSPAERRVAARMTEFAVGILWSRVGIALNQFSRRRTHAKAVEFIEKHRKLLKCVKHIQEENKDGGISRYVSSGYAVAAMYLMGCSESDKETYYTGEDRVEKDLDWSNWDRACEFWSTFAVPATKDVDGAEVPNEAAEAFRPLREAIAALSDNEEGLGVRPGEEDYLICAAWDVWATGSDTLKSGHLSITYTEPNEAGKVYLEEQRDFGGIDLGFAKDKRSEDIIEPSDIEKKEVEDRKIEVAKEKEPLIEKPKNPCDEVRVLYPELGVVFAKSALGRWVAWGADAQIVGSVIKEEPKMHPSGERNLSYKVDEIEAVLKKLLAAKMTVGMAEKKGEKWVVTIKNGREK